MSKNRQEMQVSDGDVYRCPNCRRRLPISQLKGNVTVFCRGCRKRVHVAFEVPANGEAGPVADV